MRLRHPILIGALAVALLDIVEPVIFYALRGVQPIRVFQGVAAGWLGRDSFAGGLPTALVGAATHLFIATIVVTVYWIASQKFPMLTRRPVASGIVYGLAVYVMMTFVVVPLSAAGAGIRIPPPVLLANGIFAHLVCVGLPTAFIVRAGSADAPSGTDALNATTRRAPPESA